MRAKVIFLFLFSISAHAETNYDSVREIGETLKRLNGTTEFFNCVLDIKIRAADNVNETETEGYLAEIYAKDRIRGNEIVFNLLIPGWYLDQDQVQQPKTANLIYQDIYQLGEFTYIHAISIKKDFLEEIKKIELSDARFPSAHYRKRVICQSEF